MQSILDASDRALDEARAAVDALGRDTAEPLGYALHRAARDVAERYGAPRGGGARRLGAGRPAPAARARCGSRARPSGTPCDTAAPSAYASRSRRRRRGAAWSCRTTAAASTSEAAAYGYGYGLTSMRERAQGLPGACVADVDAGQRYDDRGDLVSEQPISVVMADDHARMRTRIREALEAGGCVVRRGGGVGRRTRSPWPSSTGPTSPCSTSTCPATASPRRARSPAACPAPPWSC